MAVLAVLLNAKWLMAAASALTLLAGCNLAQWRPEVVQERATGLIRAEGGGAALGQSFRIAHNGLARIDLAIAFDEGLPTADLVFRLRQPPTGSDPLREVKLASEKLNPNGYTSITFEPVADSEGKDYLLELAAPGAEGGPVLSIHYAADNPYLLGVAYRKGQPLSGDLAFRAYTSQSFSTSYAWQDFAGRAAQDWGFFASYLALLAANIVGIVFLWRPRQTRL